MNIFHIILPKKCLFEICFGLFSETTMADSDEEFDRRSRDKFRRERKDYDRRDDRSRGREPWEEGG